MSSPSWYCRPNATRIHVVYAGFVKASRASIAAFPLALFIEESIPLPCCIPLTDNYKQVSGGIQKLRVETHSLPWLPTVRYLMSLRLYIPMLPGRTVYFFVENCSEALWGHL